MSQKQCIFSKKKSNINIFKEKKKHRNFLRTGKLKDDIKKEEKYLRTENENDGFKKEKEEVLERRMLLKWKKNVSQKKDKRTIFNNTTPEWTYILQMKNKTNFAIEKKRLYNRNIKERRLIKQDKKYHRRKTTFSTENVRFCKMSYMRNH